MIRYKLYKDPYDTDETLFTGKLSREIKPGLSILVGCNGSGKTTTLHSIRDAYGRNPAYKIFHWDGLRDKSFSKQRSLDLQNYEVLASLTFSSEGEEINTNIGLLASAVGNFVRRNTDKDVIVLLDGLDSGLSIDNIVEAKEFFKDLLIPDIEKSGHSCYIIASANEYELAREETCIDARSGKEMTFNSYEEYRKYILDSRKKKDARVKS